MQHLLNIGLKNKRNILGLCLIAIICSQRHAGFLIYFFVAPAAIYYLIQAIGFIKVREKLNNYLFLLIFTVTVGIEIIIVHLYLHNTTRVKANQILSAIVIYKEKYGKYPQSLTDIPNSASFPRKELMLSYSYKNKPQLFYAATHIPYAVWVYNFENQKWEGPTD